MEKQSALTSTASRAVRKCEQRLGWLGQDCTECRPGMSALSAGWAIYRPPLNHPPTASPAPPPPSPQLAFTTSSSRSTTTQLHVPYTRLFRGSSSIMRKCFPQCNLLTLFFKWDVYLTRGYKQSRCDREAKCAVHTYTFCCHVAPPQTCCRLMTKTYRQTWFNEWRTQEYMCTHVRLNLKGSASQNYNNKKILS